jgi:NADPH2:quinone reductase
MRAVVVTEYGGRAETIALPAPEVQGGQVLIKVLAAGMNPMDRAIADGAWQSTSTPTAGMTGLAIVDAVAPLESKAVLIVGAGGGVGSFATRFGANAGAHVIANARNDNAERMTAYGAAETIDHTQGDLRELVADTHPNGVDVLIDLANGAAEFANLAGLVRRGGVALSTRYVAHSGALAIDEVSAVNFRVPPSVELLERVANAIDEGSIAPPPINRISLQQVPSVFAGENDSLVDGKTVVVM